MTLLRWIVSAVRYFVLTRQASPGCVQKQSKAGVASTFELGLSMENKCSCDAESGVAGWRTVVKNAAGFVFAKMVL